MSDEEIKPSDPETLEKVRALLEDKIADKESEAESTTTSPVGERRETTRNTAYDEDNLTQHALYSWSAITPESRKVTVSDDEKACYLKAVLNDVPVILEILLEMGNDSLGNIRGTFRTLNNYEMDIVFLAIEKDREEGLISGHHQLATRLQQYAGALQLVAFQGNSTKYTEFKNPGNRSEDVKALRDAVFKYVGETNWARWQATLHMLRIFEAKVKICNDAALNGDFW